MDRLISEKSVMEVIYGCDWFIDEERAEVIKERIKAIPSAEPKTGYISIDDVMSVFDDYMCGEVDEEGTDTFLEMLRDKAEQYPQEPKTGHWIKSMRHECTYWDSDDNKLYEYVIHYKCSLCGFETGTQAEYFDYCPECGAKMIEPQERSE